MSKQNLVARNKIIKAKISLIRRQPFLGRLCLLFGFKENKSILTAATDGENFYYNKHFINSLSQEQILGILVHETLHLALGHLWRIGEREMHRWNVATDYVVNIIVAKNGFQLPEGALFDYQYQEDSAERVYDKLPPTKTLCPICYGKGGGGRKEGETQKKGKGRAKAKSTQTYVFTPCESHRLWGKAMGKSKKARKYRKKLKKKWEGAVQDVAKQRGDIPAGLERTIEELRPKEDWKEILASFLSQSFTDFDFFKRDRRTLHTPFYIPDLQDEKSLENVVVAVDTSGSITQEELNSFIAETREILRAFPRTKGWLIDCDAEVGKVVDIKKAKTQVKFFGGGGTSHIPVFEEIKKRKLNPKVVICFTDLYTEFPDKKPIYPVLWLVTPNGADIKPPFGRVIRMEDGHG